MALKIHRLKKYLLLHLVKKKNPPCLIAWENVSYTCEAASQPQESRGKLSGHLKAQPDLAEWCSSCRLSCHQSVPEMVRQAAQPGYHTRVPMHPASCLPCSLLSWSLCCKPDIEIDCAKHQYNLAFLPALPPPNQPLVPLVARLAYLLVQSGKPVVPRHKHRPNSSVAEQRYHQQLIRDTAHALHKFGPITNLPCFPCLREVGQGQGQGSYPPAAMPLPTPQHPASFPWEEPALTNNSRHSGSKAALMIIYHIHRDTSNLTSTENT